MYLYRVQNLYTASSTHHEMTPYIIVTTQQSVDTLICRRPHKQVPMSARQDCVGATKQQFWFIDFCPVLIQHSLVFVSGTPDCCHKGKCASIFRVSIHRAHAYRSHNSMGNTAQAECIRCLSVVGVSKYYHADNRLTFVCGWAYCVVGCVVCWYC